MIESLVNAESIPVLERMISFTAHRHRAIVQNIANLDTPGYTMQDLPVEKFRKELAEAIEARRRDGGTHLPPMRRGILQPHPAVDYVLFHDRNNRSVEKQMALLAENAMAHNASIEILKKQFNLLEVAIRERL